MIPGEVICKEGLLTLNEGRKTLKLVVANTGDRPVQVGSHYHFQETNAALEFDRLSSLGYRLDIPAGTAVRFEPGQSREVTLVKINRHGSPFFLIPANYMIKDYPELDATLNIVRRRDPYGAAIYMISVCFCSRNCRTGYFLKSPFLI